jgi:nucleoside-diphosphate-sugar epimerase
VADGARVRCAIRSTSDTRWIDPLAVEKVELDLRRPDRQAAKALAGIETIVHCGGVTAARREAGFQEVNTEATDRLARSAAEAGVRRIVFISSLAARGPDGHPGPASPYGRSKRDAEERLLALEDRLEVVILRPGGVYGPRDSDLLPMFQMAKRGFVLVPRADTKLQPVFVDDVGEAVLRAVRGDPATGPFPLAEDATYGWDEVARSLGDGLERPVKTIRLPFAIFWTAGLMGELGGRVARKPPAMDRRRARDFARYSWTCDPSPTETGLGWKARVTLPEGLARTARWYRENDWL